MLVVTRFSVAEADGERFAEQATAALSALAARPGYQRGSAGRAVDEPTAWVIVTEWDSVGAYRRALSAFDVKVHALPLLSTGADEPAAFELLRTVDRPGGTARAETRASDRAPDAASAAPGGFPPPREQETR
jgi:heme oxygenase (mycobilin-producing)